MQRKKFIGALIAGAGIPFTGKAQTMVAEAAIFTPDDPENFAPIIPPYLKPGDTIGITCPAGFITAEDNRCWMTDRSKRSCVQGEGMVQ